MYHRFKSWLIGNSWSVYLFLGNIHGIIKVILSCILKVILAVFLLLWYVSTGILSLSLRVEFITSALCQKHCTNQEDLIQSNLVSPLSSKHHFIKSSMLIVVAHCGFCWFCVIVASTMNHICSLSSMFFFFLVYCGYSVFHWCGQHLCKFMGTKESVCIRKEFNSHGTGLGHQLGHRLTVFFYYYYSYQLNYDTTAEINHSLHNCFLCCSPKLLLLMVFQLLLYQTTHDISPGFKPFTTMFSCGCFLCFCSGWFIKQE